MVILKRIYDPYDESDGFRILVDRFWPRGMSKEKAKVDLWMKDIGPSNELRKWFGHQEERWPEFKEKYKKELEGKKDLIADLKKLSKQHKKITLLYGARDRKHNEAVVIAEMLKRTY